MNRSETEKKLEFLHLLLEKNPDLKKQFEAFINESGERFNDNLLPYIQSEAEELIAELESLNISDPDWEYYTPRHSGYIEEWEAQMHMAEDLVMDVLDGHKAGINTLLSRGKADLALLSLVSGYEACLRADLQDEYDTLGDANFFLIESMNEIQTDVIQKLNSVVFPNRQAHQFLEVFFRHYKTDHEDDKEYLRFFEPLLLTISGDKERAAFLNKLLDEKQVPRRYIPRVATELYKVTEDKEKWQEQAENLFKEDVSVARNLLEEYSKTSYPDFIRIAQKLWDANRFRPVLAHFILDGIDRNKSPEIYKEILLWVTSNARSVPKYKLLRKVLGEKEKEVFIQKHVNDQVFYTKMLEQEQRFDEILQFIKNNRDSWHLNKMLSTILEPYPKESFAILEEKILTTLETERGRSVYQTIVEWVRLARCIKGFEEQAQQLIQRLYNWKPALPALKDELRKAGMR